MHKKIKSKIKLEIKKGPNYPKKLDSALIRSGRIDMKINFTKCTNQIYYDIIENFYNKKIEKNIIFHEKKYSPAEVLEICFSYNDNMDKAIDKLQQE
jgi:ATP-dependent 26S proteasome regulatory subunit